MSDYHDVLRNVPEKRIAVHGAGYVELIDVMPRLVPSPRTTADFAVCDAARTSYGDARPVSDERTLLRYMMRHSHSTPFEVVRFVFRVRLPLFVEAQWIRHRASSTSQLSARYTEMPDLFYDPADAGGWRGQSAANKQGSGGGLDETDRDVAAIELEESQRAARSTYELFLDRGVAREQARVVLPVAQYTRKVWSCDLRNLLHFLALRCDAHAQQEMRDYAEAVLRLVTPVVPECVAAWDDYHPLRGAVLLSRAEAAELGRVLGTATLKAGPVSDNRRENGEWDAKLRRLLAAGEGR